MCVAEVDSAKQYIDASIKTDLYLLVIILEDLIAYRGGIINIKIRPI